ncbi:MAG TPA: dihydrofolate reductase family protein [Puia sp.]
MRKLSVFMHVSVDGFTARPDGAIDWIQIGDEMFNYALERTEKSDAALYGRKTYEVMDAYWPTAADQPNASKHDIEHSTWYKAVNKYVVSETMRGKQLEKTKILSGNIFEQVKQLKQQEGQEIIMFGSPGLAGTLMNENLIDEYWLFINPVILGTGIPLFGKNGTEIKLQLVKSIPFSGGVICLHYAI